MAGIYLHIPFCKKACHYCNFHFSTSRQRLPLMMEAIRKEAALRSSYLTEKVSTVYFGGGTPSLLPAGELQSTITRLQDLFDMDSNPEITLEANPDDITQDALAAWKKAGINRLSIGIQSFFEDDLVWMNRAHTAKQAIQCIELAQEAGIGNISIDLIYGTPSLCDEKWAGNMQTAIDLQIPHLSCYALTVEPRTALARLIATEIKDNVDADKQARHFHMLTKRLGSAGFEHYEISNFALPGFRSRHNSSYWEGKPYLGLGPSAHSFNGSSRQWNIANNSLYLTALESGRIPYEEEILTVVQRLNEYIMTALRTAEGISLERIKTDWGEQSAETLSAAAEKYIRTEYLLFNNHFLQLSDEGKFLADGIAANLFADEP